MICVHCGHVVEWVETTHHDVVLRVTDSHLVIDRPSCAPWWHHEVLNVSLAARAIVQAMNGIPEDDTPL